MSNAMIDTTTSNSTIVKPLGRVILEAGRVMCDLSAACAASERFWLRFSEMRTLHAQQTRFASSLEL